MKKVIRNRSFIIALLLITVSARSQTWTGATSNDWFTASNWNPATVPGSASSVTIPGSLVTYPLLTANVTVGGITMSSGSALNLGGNTFTDSGSLSLTSATINGGGAFTSRNAGSITVSGNTITTALSVTNYTGTCNFINNTITGSTVISDSSTQTSNTNFIDGNDITGNLTITHASSSGSMYEGFNGATGNHITGNATFNLSGAGAFFSANSHGLRVDGNLTVTRTVGGATTLFQVSSAANAVGGNFSFSNTALSGATTINSFNAATVPVGGTISISTGAAAAFSMFAMKNALAGGAVSVSGATTIDVRNDTLKATVSITGYTGTCNVVDNSITGNTTVSDAALQSSNSNNIGGNFITGNLTLTHASATGIMYEGIGGTSGNRITGNADFNLTGGGTFSSGGSTGLVVGGNLTVTRTASGSTLLFSSATTLHSVGGNFSFTSSAPGGATSINSSNFISVPVGGTLSVSTAAAAAFTMHRMKNATAGGAVSVSGATDIDVRGDTLRATVSIADYTGVANIINNDITGNTIISDAASQTSNSNNIAGNRITGNLTLTHASSTAIMYEGFNSVFRSNITGNAVFNLTGGGAFVSANSSGLTVGGNLTVARTVSGATTLFNVSSPDNSVGGNFSFTNTASGGAISINPNNAITVPVGGTFSVSTGAAAPFAMYRMKNFTAGGSVSVTGATTIDVRADTLIAAVSITGYTGTAQILNNRITGNAAFSDAASQNSNTNFIDGNFIAGNLAITHASAAAIMYEGFGSTTGNRITGNADFNLTGGGPFFSANSNGLTVDGNLTVARTVSGNTTLFDVSSAANAVGGAFSYTNTGATGATSINAGNAITVPVGGTFNLSSTAAGTFTMYRMKNAISGGTATITGPTSVDIRADTLAANFVLESYTGTANVYDNSISGNAVIADAAAQSSSTNFIDGNRFGGNLTLVHRSSTGAMYDGFGSPSGNGNVVTGIDSIVNVSSTAVLEIGDSHSHRADSTIIFNAPAGIVFTSVAFGGSTTGRVRQAGVQPISVQALGLAKTGTNQVILQAPVAVAGTMTFSSGYISSSAASPLVFASGAGWSGAGNSSHATGYVSKVGSTAFTFPTGNGVNYSPAGITAPAAATDEFNAQYFRQSPNAGGYDTAMHDASINHVSKVEYWLINRGAGTSNVKVTLGYGANSGGVNAMSALTVAHWFNNGTSTAWHDEGNGGTTGTNAMGTVTSNNTISTFSPFTLASTTSANPLPVRLTTFSAKAVGSSALLQWKAESESGVTAYRIERSSNGRDFITLGSVAAKGGGEYSFTDEAPATGTNYYRLAAAENDGSSAYSSVQTLRFGKSGSSLAIFPNPASDVVYLSIPDAAKDAIILVRNATGGHMYRGTAYTAAASGIPVRAWPGGIYLLEVQGADGAVLRATFIRR